ncbi:MAG: bifunctional pyr operon transcriptional regulator/uracil phosphoribosyltransferase PyrR [Myxococcota bacterium]
MSDTLLMSAAALEKTLDELAEKLLQTLTTPHTAALMGVRTGGVYVAQRLKRRMEQRLGQPLLFGVLDITLYRDDLFSGLEKPQVGPTDVRFDIEGREIVIVDDVLFTGRTVRAALNELMDLGRPRRILLAVLLDRGHRELPIAADVVGLQVDTPRSARVLVQLQEDPRYRQDQVLLRHPDVSGLTSPSTR